MILLASLPPDLLQERILGDFCDGKTLSTLWLALATTTATATCEGNNNNNNNACRGDGGEESASRKNEQQQHLQVLKYRTALLDVIIPKVAEQRVQALVAFMHDKLRQDNNGDNSNSSSSSSSSSATASMEATTPDDVSVTANEAITWLRSRFLVMEQQQQPHNRSFNASTTTDAIIIDHLRQRMRMISEQMALLDFLEESVYVISKHNKQHFEWPIWCGQIVLAIDMMPNNNNITNNNDGSLHGNNTTRRRVTAKVMITTPMQHPRCFLGLPGYELLYNQRPCAIFQAEPYNILPVPPWGRIRPIRPIMAKPNTTAPTTRTTTTTMTATCNDTAKALALTNDDDSANDDVTALRTMAGRLQELNQVGIPTSTFSHQYSSGSRSATQSSANVLDIRIISNQQAQERLKNRSIQTSTASSSSSSTRPIWQPRNSWMADTNKNDDNDVGLLCCWQEEDESDSFNVSPTASTVNEGCCYMAHVIDFLKARERLLAD